MVGVFAVFSLLQVAAAKELASDELCDVQSALQMQSVMPSERYASVQTRVAKALEGADVEAATLICLRAEIGEAAPLPGLFQKSSEPPTPIDAGFVAPTGGQYCITRQTLALLQRSSGLLDGSSMEAALGQKEEGQVGTESSLANKFFGAEEETESLVSCSKYACGTPNWVKRVGVETAAPADEALCCEPTCAAYACETEFWFKRDAAASRRNPSEGACCVATCAAYTCQRDFWVPKEDVADLTATSDDVCCQATCAAFECGGFKVLKPGTGMLTSPGEEACCMPKWLAAGSANVNVCPVGYDYTRTEKECRAAAAGSPGNGLVSISYDDTRSVNAASRKPKGCYYYKSRAYFNDHSIGAADEDRTLICQAY